MNAISNSFGVSSKWGFISTFHSVTLVAFKRGATVSLIPIRNTYVFAFRIPQNKPCADRFYSLFQIFYFDVLSSLLNVERWFFYCYFSSFRSNSIHMANGALHTDFSIHIYAKEEKNRYFLSPWAASLFSLF